MKTLKFSKELVPLIVSGQKTTTWRLFDDKDFKMGDEMIFINKENNKAFAKAKLIKVKETTFRNLTEEDFKGKKHEKFESKEEMLKMYSDYYKTELNLDMPLKVIQFKIIEKI